jgi:hypothetical protein
MNETVTKMKLNLVLTLKRAGRSRQASASDLAGWSPGEECGETIGGDHLCGAVVKALADQTAEVRASAAEALAQMGPLDDEARKALSNSLEDADSTVRQAASEMLLEK